MDIVKGLQEMALRGGGITQPPRNFVRQENGMGTLFLVEIQPKRKAYRYDVDVCLVRRENEADVKSLAKAPDDGLRSRNRNLCYILLAEAFARTEGFGAAHAGVEIVYDCKSTLYTSQPIQPNQLRIRNEELDRESYVITYTGDRFDFDVRVMENASGHELELSDIQQYISKESLRKENRSLRTFLEMAVSMQAINEELYFPVGAGKAFQAANSLDIGGGMLLRAGLAKGVRVVQNFGKPCPALVLDYKMCPFFCHQMLVNTIVAHNRGRFPSSAEEWATVGRFVQDIRVELTYLMNRNFGIGCITDASAAETTFPLEDGSRISVYEYFTRVLGVEMQHPEWPCVMPSYLRRDDRVYYPLEFCRIIPDQRVPIEKMNRQLSERLLKENSIPPQQRMDKIKEHANAMRIFQQNAVLSAFGIRVLSDSNKVQIGIRHAPTIEFASNRIVLPDPSSAEWRGRARNLRFYQTSRSPSWVALYHKDENQRDVESFLMKFGEVAGQRGMNFGRPGIPVFTGCEWDFIFKKCVEKKVQFVVLIDSINRPTHRILKYYEAKYKILTQHISLERALDVVRRQKMAILENVLCKSNSKLFGINYVPRVHQAEIGRFSFERNLLVVGYDVANPTPAGVRERRLLAASGITLSSIDPAVIGITANMATNPMNFVGDYYYQEARRDYIDLTQLADRMKWVLEMLAKNRPSSARPEVILVLRNGLSEGQFSRLADAEMAALRDGCRAYDANYKPRFIYVVGTKRHFKKFFSAEGRQLENMKPCSVVSTKFVREDCPEFFMQSHFPLKGVGKPVEYSVLVDEANTTQDELQGLLNSLCFAHQIVNSAVSLPEPIYQADELAKRGRENYTAMKEVEQNEIPRIGPHNLIDVQRLTEMLGYRGSLLNSTRFTA